jgi:hypothetical protein
MIDFVKRDATSCKPKPTEEICHKQYHYSEHRHPARERCGVEPVRTGVVATTHLLPPTS